MTDHNSWLTRSEVVACGKPVYVTGGSGWRPERPKGWILLPRYRCAELGAHVELGEQPIAYLHVRNAIPPHSYAPLYVRSSDQIDIGRLTRAELVDVERELL
ncbi:hypothetical protein [Paenibacillus odorifer]|uniref:hypothetical protein n=1 Tax=Paenibacillus odorifer TaxID=189426 RepID=UPI00096E0397|nr:hypothetical protein [Paenibacillus odorifer]OME59462.1 hypothetical protein BSK61_05915 [Paenibacillus odorifer]